MPIVEGVALFVTHTMRPRVCTVEVLMERLALDWNGGKHGGQDRH